MRFYTFILATVASLLQSCTAGPPECTADARSCPYSLNPRLGDLMIDYLDGVTTDLIPDRERLDLTCNLDTWRVWSESCGDCVYKFEFVSGVPGVTKRACLAAMDTRPYVDKASMDINHPYNGRTMQVAAVVGPDCIIPQNISDVIVFVDTGACGDVAVSLAAESPEDAPQRFIVYASAGYNSFHENVLPLRIYHTSSEHPALAMQWGRGGKDLEILRLATQHPSAQGRVVFECGEHYANGKSEGVDVSSYTGGEMCPWWLLEDRCWEHPDVAKRLCYSCPVKAYHSDTGADLGCLQQGFLSPMRAVNSFAQRFASQLPFDAEVILVDAALLGHAFFCDFNNFDPSWSGRIVAFHHPSPFYNAPCSRVDAAVLAEQIGISAVLFLGGLPLHGWSHNVHIPVSTTYTRHDNEWLRDHIMQGKNLARGVWERRVRFGVPNAPEWESTPAPIAEAVPRLSAVREEGGFLEEPSIMVGVVMVPVLLACVLVRAAAAWRGAIEQSAAGIPLGAGSALLSLSLGVLLVTVTYIFMKQAGDDAEAAQRQNKEEAVQVLNTRAMQMQDTLLSEAARRRLASIHSPASTWIRAAEERMGVVAHALRLKHDMQSDTMSLWGAQRQSLAWTVGNTWWHNEEMGVTYRESVGYVFEIRLREGHYLSSLGVENDCTTKDCNNTDPFSLGFADTRRTPQLLMERSVYDPWETLFWAEVPPTYPDTVSFLDAMYREEHYAYVGELQVVARNSFAYDSADGKLYSPFFTGVHSTVETGLGGYVSMSWQLESMSRAVSAVQGVLNAELNENTIYALYTTNDARIVAADTRKTQTWRQVDHLGEAGRYGKQVTYQTFTLYDTPQLELNAYARFIVERFGQLAPRTARQEASVEKFRFRDHFSGYHTAWVHLAFNGTIEDRSWHNWDTFSDCTSCISFTTGRTTDTTAISFNGSSVRVRALLTARVPRVASRRHHPTFGYYRNISSVHNVSDVVMTQRNLRPSIEGARYVAALREDLFMVNDYSVSLWVRLEESGGVLVADTLTADSFLQVRADGAVVVGVIFFGCRTAPLKNLRHGVWEFLTVVVQYSGAGHCTMYLNGVQEERGLMSLKAYKWRRFRSRLTAMVVGHNVVGAVSELVVHNRTLSVAAVQRLMVTGDAVYVPDTELLAATTQVYRNIALGVVLPVDDMVQSTRREFKAAALAMQIQNENTDRALKQKSTGALLIATAVLLCASIVFITFNSYLTRPFAQFAAELAHVSQAEVEGIARYRENRSPLREINVMQVAINTLVANMREYKTFLPEAVFLARQQAEDATQAAPGCTTGVATLVFTDIKGSTELWETCHDAMRTSLALHNALIRSKLHQHSGYEVKTVGDAFMIAFDLLESAICFSAELQGELVGLPWPAALLAIPRCAPDGTGQWGGLRIRIGINSGPVTLEWNDIMCRYDYFGPVVNRAARLEGCCIGGAISMQDDVLSMAPLEVLQRVVSIPLGAKTLQGVQEDVDVTLLVPSWMGQRALDVQEQALGDVSHAFGTPPVTTNPLVEEDLARSRYLAGRAVEACVRLGGTLDAIHNATIGVIEKDERSMPHDGTLTDELNFLLTTIVQSLDRTEGKAVTVVGAATVVAWNVTTRSATHIVNSLRFIGLLTKQTNSVRAGLANGRVMSGYLGTSGQRFVTVVGRCMRTAMGLLYREDHLESLALYSSADPLVMEPLCLRGYLSLLEDGLTSLYEVHHEALQSACEDAFSTEFAPPFGMQFGTTAGSGAVRFNSTNGTNTSLILL